MSSSDHAVKFLGGIIFTLFLSACGGGSSDSPTPVSPDENTDEVIDPPISIPSNNTSANTQGDISYLKLSNRDPDCAAYAGEYHASIYDKQQSIFYDSYLTITADDDFCTFTSNNIPNHDVGGNTTTGANFASQVTPNNLDYVLLVPRYPARENAPTYVNKIGGSLTLNGIMLNGVDLDMDSAFCYNVEFTTPLQIGLGTRDQCGLLADWYAVPAENPDYVVLDEFTGHSFSGRYHYHSDNNGLSNVETSEALESGSEIIDPSGSPVIGFAPDGFPIYGHYFYDTETNTLRKAKSSWQTYTDERTAPSGSSDPVPPIATHERGIFVEDWYYAVDSGDLDECNGMVDAYGNYGYYYTEDYPYGPRCSFGVPDPSFIKPSDAYNNGGVN